MTNRETYLRELDRAGIRIQDADIYSSAVKRAGFAIVPKDLVTTARALLDATIMDAGEDDTDDGPVALAAEGFECAVTFKHIRELKAALAALGHPE